MHQWIRYTPMPTDRLYDVEKATSAWIDIFVTDAVVGMDAVKWRDENCCRFITK